MRRRLLLIVVIVSAVFWVGRHFQLDDSLIYARYIRNALRGNGLVFNPGERVNALTSPLYEVLLLGVAWVVHGHVMLAEFLLCGAALIAACAVAEQIVPWSGVLVACTTYFYTCIGMETFLFLFFLALLTLLYLRGQLDWLPTVAVLTVLTRFEGAGLVLVIAIQMVRDRLRPAWWSYLPPTLLFVAYLVFNHAFYGSWLPSSATAKMEQGFSGYWGKWPRAFLARSPLLWQMFQPSAYVVPLGIALALLGMWKEGWSRLNRTLLPYGVLLGGFYVGFNIPNYHWYYAPFIFFISLYAMRGLPQNRVAYVCLGLAVCQCTWVAMSHMSRQKPVQTYVDLGNWLRMNTKPDARIAAVETGTLGWYSDRYIDDLMGLTDPGNAKRILHHDLRSWLPEQRPDYVVMKNPPSFGEIAAAESQDYVYLTVHFDHTYLMKRKDSTR